MSSAIAKIEKRIDQIEVELARSIPLIRERDRLLKGRGSCSATQPTGGRRVSRDDVLGQRPGLRAGEIAQALGVDQPAIPAYLYRGKGSRFESRGRRWFIVESAARTS